jgi:N-acetylmuramic acid 6-phosphate etherase
VESFEDYPSFGKQQVRGLNITKGDCLIAITEGGETPSVLGSIEEALDRNAKGFLLFNNPAEILRKHIERSRKTIENPNVTVLDLSCGPMALTGSTRMQATTSELLIAGTALEKALNIILAEKLSKKELERTEISVPEPSAKRFSQLLDDLQKSKNVKSMADFIALEEKIYRQNGLVTYYANDLLLDIFTDTTERAPTFMLPPFRKIDDSQSPPSWAFVKNPLYNTPETWHKVFARSPRCLEWSPELFQKLGAEPELAADPPKLDADELFKFLVGKEPDQSRLRSPSLALAICLAQESYPETSENFFREFMFSAENYNLSRRIIIGSGAKIEGDIEFALELQDSPLQLMSRLAVKLILNTVSTGTMVRMGRVTKNWMSWVETTNKKLIDRSTRLIAQLTDLDYRQACYALFESLEEIGKMDFAGNQKPSPVQYTLNKLKNNKDVRQR